MNGKMTVFIFMTILLICGLHEMSYAAAPVFTDGDSTTRSIDEHIAGVDIPIGTPISATDADNDTLTYTIGGTDAAWFKISGNNGQLKTRDSAQYPLDHEIKDTYYITVSVSDGNGGSDSINVTININDRPEFSDGDSITFSVPENIGPGGNVGLIRLIANSIFRLYTAQDIRYELTGPHAALFDCEQLSDRHCQLKTKAPLNHDGHPPWIPTSPYTVTLTVRNDHFQDSIDITINTTDVDEPPVFFEGSNTVRSIEPNTPAGTPIGAPLKISDDSPIGSYTYGLEGPDAVSFKIETDAQNHAQLRSAELLDKDAYLVTVTFTGGEAAAINVNIGVEVDDTILETLESTETAENIEPPVSVERYARLILRPSRIAMDRVIFDEIHNTADDKNDWLELRNVSSEPVSLQGWEISLVNSNGQNANKDMDVVVFPDYMLPAGGILLITNTHPGDSDLIRGQDITNPNNNPDMPPQCLIAPKMRLPDAPYLLILRSETDKNGKSEAFEDLVGNYFRGSVDYGTQVWPLMHTRRPPNRGEALLTQEQAWQRVAVDERGYTKEAWGLSGYQAGLGYRPGASTETSLGTPGYPSTSIIDETGTGQISFSEVMYTTQGGLFSLAQWIELYNNSTTEVVNLKGWKLTIESRDAEDLHQYWQIEFNTLEVLPNQTVLLVTRNRRHSKHLPARRVYDLFRHHAEIFRPDLRENKVLSTSGFALKLLSPNGTLVDKAGNLDGRRFSKDAPTWDLPAGRTESGARTSLIRRYRDHKPLVGTEVLSWVRAADTLQLIHTYWGSPKDHGTPGYRHGGPLPVALSHFRADRTDAGAVIKWTTESEMENAGFNIFRSQTKQNPFVKVNPALILGNGTTAERHEYTWTDTTAKPGVVYYYRIEEVSLSGNRQPLMTVRLRGHVSPGGKLLHRWADVKTQN